MTIESLVEQLFDDNSDQRAEAARQLCQADNIGKAAPALLDACLDKDERVRQWAAEALESLGAPSRVMAPLLTQRLASANGDVAYWAATLLGRLGSHAAAATEPLAELLEREDAAPAARERAAWAIGQIGPEANAAIASLKSAAESQHQRLARLAREALQTVQGTP